MSSAYVGNNELSRGAGTKNNVTGLKPDPLFVNPGHFSVGNEFWRNRQRHGRRPKFQFPEQLLDASVRYFLWVQSHPLIVEDQVVWNGRFVRHQHERPRVMSIQALCSFIAVSHRQWNNWKREGGKQFRADLVPVIDLIEGVVFVTQFEGAAAGIFKANIVSSQLWRMHK
jgi:hypothetical protein